MNRSASRAASRGSARRRDDGAELGTFGKIAYKPVGLTLGMIGGLVAGKVFGIIWKRISGEGEVPQPLSDDYSTREVLLAATIQGAVFGLVKTAIDRYGMKGVRRVLDAPPPAHARRNDRVRHPVNA
ncbi:MAG: DUF4235 domain-containing protein [Pseudonocardia sp.]